MEYRGSVCFLFFFSPLLGCTGALAYELTKAHPELTVTVFDLPAVVELSECFQPQHPDNRVSFVAGTLLLIAVSSLGNWCFG